MSSAGMLIDMQTVKSPAHTLCASEHVLCSMHMQTVHALCGWSAAALLHVLVQCPISYDVQLYMTYKVLYMCISYQARRQHSRHHHVVIVLKHVFQEGFAVL